MLTKEAVAALVTGAILGISGAMFSFQGRLSRLEAEITHLRESPRREPEAPRQVVSAPPADPAPRASSAFLNAEPDGIVPVNLVFGPADGVLPAATHRQISTRRLGLRVRDFAAQARFYNPADRSQGGWSYGFMFRDSGPNEQFRLTVDSNENWALSLATLRDRRLIHQTLASGTLSNLNLSPAGSNVLTLHVKDYTGVFTLNGLRVATLALSAKDLSGDVFPAANLDDAYGRYATRYEQFSVWEVR